MRVFTEEHEADHFSGLNVVVLTTSRKLEMETPKVDIDTMFTLFPATVRPTSQEIQRIEMDRGQQTCWENSSNMYTYIHIYIYIFVYSYYFF